LAKGEPATVFHPTVPSPQFEPGGSFGNQYSCSVKSSLETIGIDLTWRGDGTNTADDDNRRRAIRTPLVIQSTEQFPRD